MADLILLHDKKLDRMIDHFSLQPALLKQSGIGNLIYRNLAMMLQPELFLKASNSALNPEYARRLLDRVCNYIKAHISQNITIATLERVSNMSARNLHYAFLKRYNTTPMKWVRRERLVLAQSQLLSAIPGSTVTSIALSCGFSKPSAFSNYYFEAFGELPSLTLSKALKR
jgi:AraC-like DNA-binding protein